MEKQYSYSYLKADSNFELYIKNDVYFENSISDNCYFADKLTGKQCANRIELHIIRYDKDGNLRKKPLYEKNHYTVYSRDTGENITAFDKKNEASLPTDIEYEYDLLEEDRNNE